MRQRQVMPHSSVLVPKPFWVIFPRCLRSLPPGLFNCLRPADISIPWLPCCKNMLHNQSLPSTCQCLGSPKRHSAGRHRSRRSSPCTLDVAVHAQAMWQACILTRLRNMSPQQTYSTYSMCCCLSCILHIQSLAAPVFHTC